MEKKTPRLNLPIDEKMLKALEREAFNSGLSTAELARRAIATELIKRTGEEFKSLGWGGARKKLAKSAEKSAKKSAKAASKTEKNPEKTLQMNP